MTESSLEDDANGLSTTGRATELSTAGNQKEEGEDEGKMEEATPGSAATAKADTVEAASPAADNEGGEKASKNSTEKEDADGKGSTKTSTEDEKDDQHASSEGPIENSGDAATLEEKDLPDKETKKKDGDTSPPKKNKRKAVDEEGPPKKKKKKIVKTKKTAEEESSKMTKEVKKGEVEEAADTKSKTTKTSSTTTTKEKPATDETTITAKKKTPVKAKPTRAKPTTKTSTSSTTVTTPKAKPANKTGSATTTASNRKKRSSTTSTRKKKASTTPKPRGRGRPRAARTPSPPPQLPSSLSPPPSPPGPPPMDHAQDLLKQVEFALAGIQPDLDATKSILEKHHQPTILANEAAKANAANNNNATAGNTPTNTDAASITTTTIANSTGGHCNTNHHIVLTGDPVLDKIREYQRHYQQRQRNLVPETKGTDRWDKPKILGQRRRRIHRQVDRPEAPHEPPPVGFTVFVGQMTTKIRHDRLDKVHRQPAVMQEIAKLWKDDMTDLDKQHYNEFAKEARAEYIQQQMEYRASGRYTPSSTFVRLGSGNNTAEQHGCVGASNTGGGPWIHKNPAERNALEGEIAAYETVDFPPRPPQLNEEYQWRDWRSKLNRKLKLRKLIVDYQDALEQIVVASAVDAAKHYFIDVCGATIRNVDHSAVLAMAADICVAKFDEMKRARDMADAPPPALDDPKSQQQALRLSMFPEEGAMMEVPTDTEDEMEGNSEAEDEDEEEEEEEPKKPPVRPTLPQEVSQKIVRALAKKAAVGVDKLDMNSLAVAIGYKNPRTSTIYEAMKILKLDDLVEKEGKWCKLTEKGIAQYGLPSTQVAEDAVEEEEEEEDDYEEEEEEGDDGIADGSCEDAAKKDDKPSDATQEEEGASPNSKGKKKRPRVKPEYAQQISEQIIEQHVKRGVAEIKLESLATAVGFTNYRSCAVQAALKLLVKDGLVEKVPGICKLTDEGQKRCGISPPADSKQQEMHLVTEQMTAPLDKEEESETGRREEDEKNGDNPPEDLEEEDDKNEIIEEGKKPRVSQKKIKEVSKKMIKVLAKNSEIGVGAMELESLAIAVGYANPKSDAVLESLKALIRDGLIQKTSKFCMFTETGLKKYGSHAKP